MPSAWALAMNSPASQNVTSGASVSRYTVSSAAPASHAPRRALMLRSSRPSRARFESLLLDDLAGRLPRQHVTNLRGRQVAIQPTLHRGRNRRCLLGHDDDDGVRL